MKIITLKIPGAGAIIDKSIERHFHWYGSYRNKKIDNNFFESMFKKVIDLSSKYKVCITPGGIGAFLYINFAKELSLSKTKQVQIGIDSFNIVSDIFLSYLLNIKARVYPSLVDVSELNRSFFKKNDIILLKGSLECQSSDSLAAHAALILKSTLVYLKCDIPNFYVGFPEPTVIHSFDIDELIKKCKEYEEKTGNQYFIDLESLLLIKKYKINTFLIHRSEVHNINKYITKKSTYKGCTIIKLPDSIRS